MKQEYYMLIILLALIFGAIIGGLFIKQKSDFERELYINRLYDKDRIIDMWENRATDNLKLVRNYCDDLTDKYSYVIFNASDCQLITETQEMVCEKSNPLFVIQN